MATFSQTELNSIRELVIGHQTVAAKMQTYAGQVQDVQLKQMFQKASQDASESAKNLINLI